MRLTFYFGINIYKLQLLKILLALFLLSNINNILRKFNFPCAAFDKQIHGLLFIYSNTCYVIIIIKLQNWQDYEEMCEG